MISRARRGARGHPLGVGRAVRARRRGQPRRDRRASSCAPATRWSGRIRGRPSRLALEAADALGLPLMVHVIDMGMPLPELLAQMRPGDVVTHCFHGNEGGLLDEGGRVWPEAVAARERGILFDVGHGVGSFTWRVARAALAQGFPPDTISSDIHAYNHAGPVHDLPRTLSKLLHLGMPLDEVIAAATVRVGEHLARVAPAGLGTLAPGAPGDLSLLELRARPLRADRRRAPPLGRRDRARRGAPRGPQRRARRGRRSRATSPRDGAPHRRRPRRRRPPACSTEPTCSSRTAASSAVGETAAGARELDARGCWVLPGGFDPHAHVYEGLAAAPAAALRSGTTAVEAYAPPAPGERVEDACARWVALAAGAACRIEPLATVYEPDALDEASFAALAAQGVRGIKLFLAYRELGMDADDERAPARAPLGSRARRRAAAALRERGRDPGAARAAARGRRPRHRRASALAATARRGGGRSAARSTWRAWPRPGLHRPRLDRRRRGGDPARRAPRAST